ncbi:TonB-dependent receptor [Pontibacter sp. 172403-2]|uniref:SusC/RagA family TonB-linked outer membrane protein n=1 Tax=Pontibacter rufus TaxID=2791028 RepID=UPI0018AFC5DF|nr:TonB-dependent receptor [Pontibacter sp. 172403-2]MBF9255166.1 TonB-dependent receptor [Pontibacter sp. 172403-2]
MSRIYRRNASAPGRAVRLLKVYRQTLPLLAGLLCLLIAVAGPAQAQTASGRQPITGQVTDAQGQPLIGVTVLVKNTSIGTASDADGRFTINAAPADVLQFSYVGYETKEVPVGNQTTLQVSMATDAKSLEEVVVVGYGTQKKSELVSSVSVVSGEDLRDVTSNNTAALLQGKASGVVVSSASGQPGTAPTIRIRGTGSITAGAEPLYVVDGVIGGTANPSDIESITVLKDAAATGLYGSRAANGVIVITTKRGKAGKTQVSYNGTTGISQRMGSHFEVMNGQQLFDYTNGLYQNDYAGKRASYIAELSKTNPSPSEADINAYLTSKNLPLTYADYVSGVLPAQPGNTNWLDEAFRTGTINSHQLSASGGSEKTRFYLSGTYFQEQGTVINTDYEQTNFRVNIDHDINADVTVTARVNALFSNRNNDPTGAIYQSYINLPWDNPYNADGTIRYVDSGTEGWYGRDRSNFLYTSQYNYDRQRGQALTGDLKLEYRITDWLAFSTTNRYSTSNYRAESNNDLRTSGGAAVNGELSNSYWYENSFLTSNLLTLNKAFGLHNVRGILGAEYQANYNDGINATGQGIFPDLEILDAAATPYLIGGYKSENKFLSGFVNVDYDYKSKYFATASFRRDGSSRFGADKRFGNFYSFGAAWDIASEDFFQGLSGTVNQLKLRSSYGATGNADISDFSALDLYEFSVQYANQPGGFPRRLVNRDLTWEKAYTFDIGVDIGLLNRIDVALDFYNRTNKAILQDVPLSSATGFYFQTQNIGSVRNRGIDIEVNSQNLKGAFAWETSLNLSFNRNKVLELYGGQPIDRGSQRVEVGRPIESWFMRDWKGVDPATGNPLWLLREYDDAGNIVKDTVTSSYNSATRVYTGTSTPKFSGGIRNTFSYKNFTLDAFINFIYGNKVYNYNRELFDSDGAYPTYNSMVLQDGWSRWEQEGDIATHPRPVLNGNRASNKVSSRYLEDGSYLRLRNVTLSYDVPTAFAGKLKLQSLRVFVSGDNLWTLTDFSGLDPEVDVTSGSSATRYPSSRKLLLGLNVNF